MKIKAKDVQPGDGFLFEGGVQVAEVIFTPSVKIRTDDGTEVEMDWDQPVEVLRPDNG